jgi:putative endonuclease
METSSTNPSTITLYVLLCTDGTLYTGITNNLLRRLIEHSTRPSYYMRNHKPYRLLYTQEFPDRRTAAIAESTLKRLPAWKFIRRLYTAAGLQVPTTKHLTTH